jgi:hypothetical protein
MAFVPLSLSEVARRRRATRLGGWRPGEGSPLAGRDPGVTGPAEPVIDVIDLREQVIR